MRKADGKTMKKFREAELIIINDLEINMNEKINNLFKIMRSHLQKYVDPWYEKYLPSSLSSGGIDFILLTKTLITKGSATYKRNTATNAI